MGDKGKKDQDKRKKQKTKEQGAKAKKKQQKQQKQQKDTFLGRWKITYNYCENLSLPLHKKWAKFTNQNKYRGDK